MICATLVLVLFLAFSSTFLVFCYLNLDHILKHFEFGAYLPDSIREIIRER